jgi:putative DNA primase/helicase
MVVRPVRRTGGPAMTLEEQTENVRQKALERMEDLCRYLLPNGRKKGCRWYQGTLDGDSGGDSFDVNLNTGVFGDWAEGDMRQGGIDLWMSARKVDFLTARSQLAGWLGISIHNENNNGNGSTPHPRKAKPDKPLMSEQSTFDWASLQPLSLGDQGRLSKWRGFSPEFVSWLVEQDLIRVLFYYGDKHWAFPVVKDGRIEGCHHRPMIWNGSGKPSWGFNPKKDDGGPGAQPFVVGNLAAARQVHVFESTWDSLAACDRLGLHASDGVAAYCTRGAANGGLIRAIPNGEEILVWMQNDPPEEPAALRWLDKVSKSLTVPARVVYVPEPHKDLNDWLRAGATVEDLERVVREAKPLPTTAPKLDSQQSPERSPEDAGTAKPEPFPGKTERPCFRVHQQETKFQGRLYEPGTYYHALTVPKKEGADPVPVSTRICAPLDCTAITRDSEDGSYGTVLEFRSLCKVHKTWAMPRRMLAGRGEEALEELFDVGLDIDRDHRNLVLKYIGDSKPEKQLSAAGITGWYDERTFVLPSEVIGNEGVCYQSMKPQHEYSKSGTLDQWQDEIAAKAESNPNLTLAIAAAFGGPLLRHVHLSGAGIHFVGNSSTGKTTLLQAAQSVWGSENFSRAWRATANGLEAAASLHTDTVLPLDEIGEVAPKELDAAAYALVNGYGKARADRTGGSRQPARWRVLVLSTGETTIEARLASGGISVKAGQTLRILNLPADGKHGAFDCLHDYPTGRDFSDAIKCNAKKYYGHAGPEFVRRLIDWMKEGLDLEDRFNTAQGRFEHRDDQEGRAAKTFALVGLAGELGIEFGLLPWEKDSAMQDAITLYKRWQAGREIHREGATLEDSTMLKRVAAFIEKHADSRSSALKPKEAGEDRQPMIRDRIGYWETRVDQARLKEAKERHEAAEKAFKAKKAVADRHMELNPSLREAAKKEIEAANREFQDVEEDLHAAEVGDRIYLLFGAALEEAVPGYDCRRIAAALNTAGALTRSGKGQLAPQRRTPNGGNPRLYHIDTLKLIA